MLDTGIGYDIIIKCGGRKWYLHKDVLKAGSRWFKVAFEGDFSVSLVHLQAQYYLLHISHS